MADDMTDAAATMQAMQGVENHPYGFILIRMVRLVQAARTVLASQDARITALEQKVTRLGG